MRLRGVLEVALTSQMLPMMTLDAKAHTPTSVAKVASRLSLFCTAQLQSLLPCQSPPYAPGDSDQCLTGLEAGFADTQQDMQQGQEGRE